MKRWLIEEIDTDYPNTCPYYEEVADIHGGRVWCHKQNYYCILSSCPLPTEKDVVVVDENVYHDAKENEHIVMVVVPDEWHNSDVRVMVERIKNK